MSIHAQLAAPQMRTEGFPEFVRMREWADPGFRHKLARWWGPAGQTDPYSWLPWIMLNPSTADGKVNDPTLLRIIRFSWMWGFNGLVVFNLYPWRTSSPRELAQTVVGWADRQYWWVRDTIWRNHNRIAKELEAIDAAMVAWGSPAGSLGLETEMWAEQLFDTINCDTSQRERTLQLWCLGKTKAGDPIHPMARGRHRVPNDARPIAFDNPGTISIGDPVPPVPNPAPPHPAAPPSPQGAFRFGDDNG
ncbi:DUF1643 domain-containing protein [Xanthobacter aminoxidans]|uniref:DUF1643 domain-containing protein n=1 Tax=Xanthobacter aminoxidans TaxID=186280 RepID=UPI00202310FA|nr:DUF1643 domain-containing protein [Xanthobacter aminoxidans]MCL8382115.1 DUF1643 domain-containing protein [Xanthobacter aminoxidans]